MDLDPKNRFIKSQHARQFADLVVTEAFLHGAEAALSVMQSSQMASDKDNNSAAANYWRMEGARQYLSTLVHLTDSPPERVRDRKANLNHNLK